MTFVDSTRDHMEWYRRGHNEHDWKSCDGQKPSEGSNPSHSAKNPERICVRDFYFFPIHSSLCTDTFLIPGSSNDFFGAAAFFVAPRAAFVEKNQSLFFCVQNAQKREKLVEIWVARLQRVDMSRDVWSK